MFLSSYDGELREPLVLPQESQVSMQVARGLSGFLSSQCWVLSPHLQLRKQTSVFLFMLTWILGSYVNSTRSLTLLFELERKEDLHVSTRDEA